MSEPRLEKVDIGPPRRTFMDRVLAGEALVADIDDWIEAWHDGAAPDLELHEYLGMTWEEYQLYGADERKLGAIFFARKRHKTLAEAAAAYEPGALAARGQTAGQRQEIEQFLADLGLAES